MRQQAVRLQTIVDGVDEAIVTIDGHKGKFCQLTWVPPSILVTRQRICWGTNVSRFMPEPLALAHDDFLQTTIKQDVECFRRDPGSGWTPGEW